MAELNTKLFGRKVMKRTSIRLVFCLALMLVSTPLWAAESQEDLAKASQNPVADMVSIPVQSNFNFDYGQDRDKSQIVTNVQPVIPISLNKDWNLITTYHNPDNLHGISLHTRRGSAMCSSPAFSLPQSRASLSGALARFFNSLHIQTPILEATNGVQDPLQLAFFLIKTVLGLLAFLYKTSGPLLVQEAGRIPTLTSSLPNHSSIITCQRPGISHSRQ